MKLNWGTGIAIFYGTFMVVMVTFVIKSKEVNHSLVVEDYYAKDLAYQAHKDRIANTNLLETDLQISQKQTELVFQFPKELSLPTGEILLYRPSDDSKDISVEIQTNELKELRLNTGELDPGLWRIKVNWEAEGKEFYKEQILTI